MREQGGGRSGAVSAAVGSVICILYDTNENNTDEEMVEIYYAFPDYKPTGHSSSSRTIVHQDVIKFTLVTQRCTSKKYARDITLVRSELERRQEERKEKLLEDATLERGRVTSIKGEFGFLWSTMRVEEVYFHVSHIFPEDESVAAPSSSSSSDQRSRGSKKPTRSLGARKIRPLPAVRVQL